MDKNSQKNIDYLYQLSHQLLLRLKIPHTTAYLKEVVSDWYYIRIGMSTDPPASLSDIQVTDPFSPNNLAIVLVDVLTIFQIKVSITDNIPFDSEYSIFIIPSEQKLADTPLLLYGFPKENKNHLTLLFPFSFHPKKKYKVDNMYEFVLSFHTTSHSREPDYSIHKRKKRFQFAGILILIGTALTWLWYTFYSGFYNNYTQQLSPLLILHTLAIIICYQLYQIENSNHYGSSFLQKVCTRGKSFGCADVLSSPGSKIGGILSLTSVGFVFFMSNLLWLLLGIFTNMSERILPWLFWIYLCTLPFTLYALLYQRFIIKKWCILCLTVTVLIWFTFFYLWIIEIPLQSLSISVIFYWLNILIVTGIFTFVLTKLHATRENLSDLKYQLLSQQADYSTFIHQLKRWPTLMHSHLPGDIQLGNNNKPILLSIVSPTCVHCFHHYTLMKQWLHWMNDEISIVFRLSVIEKTAPLLEDIILLLEQNKINEADSYLNRWFQHSNKITVEEYHAQNTYMHEPATDNIKNILSEIIQWHNTYPLPTPTMFYKGHQIPPFYSNMSILQYLIQTDLEQTNADEN
jgi:uncharacterized membrane protein